MVQCVDVWAAWFVSTSRDVTSLWCCVLRLRYTGIDSQLTVDGPVDYRHLFVNMSDVTIESDDDSTVKRTCRPAMGYGFAAGTTGSLHLAPCGLSLDEWRVQ